MRAFLGLLLAFPSFFQACTPSEMPGSSVSFRDSAGIQITESSFEALASAPEWILSQNPVLKVGALEGADPFQFFQVRGTVLLQDLVWVLDRGSFELRSFRLDGTHAQTAGRKGDGPGEFTLPAQLLAVDPNRLIVWDQEAQRISYFDSQGIFLRSTPIHVQLPNPSLVAALDDGSFLFSSFQPTLPATSSVEVTPLSVIRVDSAGHSKDTVGVFPHIRMVKTERPTNYLLVTFSPLTSVSGDRRTFWVGTGETCEVQQRDPNGTLVQIVRWHGSDRTISKEHEDSSLAKLLENARTKEARRRIRQTWEQTPVADEFPSLANLVVDRIGRVWVQQYRQPRDDGTLHWIVFGENGGIMARIRLPQLLRPHEFGEDYVLGVVKGDSDEEYVVLYTIQQTGGEG